MHSSPVHEQRESLEPTQSSITQFLPAQLQDFASKEQTTAQFSPEQEQVAPAGQGTTQSFLYMNNFDLFHNFYWYTQAALTGT